MKKLAHRAFADQNSRLYRYTNDILAIATVVSIFTLVLETVQVSRDICSGFS